MTTQSAHVAATGTAAPVAASKIAAPAPAPAPANQSAVKPIVDTNAAPAPAHTTTAARSHPDNTAIELGAGALALIALGGGAWALGRRRSRDEEFVEETYEPAHEPVQAEPATPAAAVHSEQPAIVAPSAFAWGNQQATSRTDDGSDRRPGESWVERAYRGPSPANPSVSLRARLKRAAFFDKREREVAAGTAEPVETDAGLPEAMVDEQEREFA